MMFYINQAQLLSITEITKLKLLNPLLSFLSLLMTVKSITVFQISKGSRVKTKHDQLHDLTNKHDIYNDLVEAVEFLFDILHVP